MPSRLGRGEQVRFLAELLAAWAHAQLLPTMVRPRALASSDQPGGHASRFERHDRAGRNHLQRELASSFACFKGERHGGDAGAPADRDICDVRIGR